MEQVARVEPVLTLARFKSATALRDGACAYLLAAEKRSRHATIVIFFIIHVNGSAGTLAELYNRQIYLACCKTDSLNCLDRILLA